ncbi:MAG: FMN-binding protein [Acidobacteria bacterium]|nr:FMN-binding protein [Acidobacteriota bacterium]
MVLLTVAALCSPVVAGDLLTREEALAACYPGAAIEAQRVFLTADQLEKVAALSGSEVPSALVARYVARTTDAVVGRAYVDTHVVRTKRESLLISLTPDGRVRRIDVTAFLEPREYLASEPWRAQYRDRELNDDLGLQRAIRPIAGATLTAHATNAAVRRVLAIDRVLARAGEGP